LADNGLGGLELLSDTEISDDLVPFLFLEKNFSNRSNFLSNLSIPTAIVASI
jgi:cytochrome b involved in lipid metabolism